MYNNYQAIILILTRTRKMKTQNKISTLSKILIGMLLALILYIIIKDFIMAPRKAKVDPKTAYNYKQEIVYIDKPYPVFMKSEKEKAEDRINPLLLEKFKQLEDRLILQGITRGDDGKTTVNFADDTTTVSYIYDEKFFKEYPNNSKLIDFRLTLDSLKIALLNTQGETERKTYPLYFSDFEYYWVDNELHKTEIKRKKESKLWNKTNWNELYINPGYSFLVNRPQLGLEYNLKVWRIKLDLSGDMLIQEKPQLFVTAKLGYRLFQ